jgi:acetoacetyl-CoA synthetase
VTASERRPLWTPTAEDIARANVTRFMAWLDASRGLRFDDYELLRRWSIERLEDFWEAVWDFYALGDRPPGAVLSSRDMSGARWFEGARLNYAEQVLSRAPQERPAVRFVAEGRAPEAISAADLRGQVGALANALRDMGVGPGDRVGAYLPNIPEAVVAMLAVTSLGAVWAVCAPDFGAQSVVDRLAQVEPSVLIAVDGYRFGGKVHDRRDVVRELASALPSVRRAILVRSVFPDEAPPQGLAATPLDELVREPAEPAFADVAFDHPLWILFSSGTTGKPKGIVQGHGGIVVEHLKALGLCLDLGPSDTYFFHSSTSWMAWNYLVGGLLHGSTIVLYDGSPSHPVPGALWEVASATRATVFGMGSAYVSACRRASVTPTGVDAVRTVIPTGSPLPSAGWDWLGEQLGGGVRIDSICGGTDVCTAFFGGSPLLPVFANEISTRWLGVAAEAWNGSGQRLTGEVGELVLTAPLPSMPLALWNDPEGARYRDAYFAAFPCAWRQGDWITIDERGGITVHGRSDATINRGGVRMGSAEIYTVVERLAAVADSLVVGVEHDDGDYYMPLFVVPADGRDEAELADAIRAAIRGELSPRHVPDEIIVAPAIPRTLTGKKLEVPIKRILQGVDAADAAALGSVDRPEALAWFEAFAAARTRG